MPELMIKTINHKQPNASGILTASLVDNSGLVVKDKGIERFNDIVVICIGTNYTTGDVLGPMVGSLLLRAQDLGAHVFGTINFPIHAMNMRNILTALDRDFDPARTLRIVVDASLGYPENVGNINIYNSGINPGTALDRELPSVGDMSVTGVVNVHSDMNHIALREAKIPLVCAISRVISKGIQDAVYYINKNQGEQDDKVY